MIHDHINTIISEINQVFSITNETETDHIINQIIQANTIITLGAGRVGLVCRAFSMRLAHLGLKAFNIYDSVVPSIGKNDLLFICSGSGETQTVFDLALKAKYNGASLALITCNPKSRIGKISNTIVTINAPSKTNPFPFKSIQPMTTLTEQSFYILTDAIVLSLMDKLNQTNESMLKRHSILE